MFQGPTEIFLLQLLQKYEKLFDGTLGQYSASDYTIELRKNAKSYHIKPFPFAKIYEQNLNQEVNRKNLNRSNIESS